VLAAGICAWAQQAVDIAPVTEQHVMVPMRDGTKLSTYITTVQISESADSTVLKTHGHRTGIVMILRK
jgi:hypothetical protein